jgi:two-component system, cell cycle sensor histidine kinase and response regulator CckA
MGGPISPKPAQSARKYQRKIAAVRTLRRAVEQCQELVFVTDVAGVIQYANPACEVLTGYTNHELLATSLDHVSVQLPKAESWGFLCDRALETGVFRGSIGFLCKNDNVAELDLAITVVRDPHTNAASLVCTAGAVALQKEIQPRPERADAMNAIGALTSGVAHDFNNLLMVIGANAEMGMTTVPPDHAARRNLQEILAAVRRASDLTRRLLASGRQATKGQQLVSINWIIEDTAAMLSRVIEEDIEVRVSLGKNIGLVRADLGQIEQILLNLAVNARDAMPNGGKFIVTTESVRLDDGFTSKHPGMKSGEHVLLRISDSGHGMRAEELTRIFEPYYTTKAAGKGTGLGLAIVDSIVRQNGGCIFADSKPGAGTSFEIYLPIETNVAKKPPASWREEVPSAQGQERLLIVEDAEPLRFATAEYLASLGYKVSVAGNGEEALRLLEVNRDVDLVIVDVVMPHMNGPIFSRHVIDRYPQIKLLFTSGHTESVLLQKGMPTSQKNFLQKPFSQATLAVKIREILDEPVPAHALCAAAGR